MKRTNIFYGILSFFVFGTMLSACSNSDDPSPKPTPKEEVNNEASYKWGTDGGIKSCDHLLFNKGTVIGNGDKEFVFTGKQSLPKGTYSLKGWVYIADGAQLTLAPGTVIKGDKASKAAIIVERGGKLIAQGSADAPIVFTSAQPKGQRKPGDWGGIILCGKAKNNLKDMQIEGGPRTHHGGNDDADNSGVLSYVRIEFAGYPFEKDKEINGLTFGSVGSGTKIDHVQVSYSNDDSYEWFGGTVNCKYMIAYKGWDDDFDTDNGYRGHVQFCLSVRDPRIADASLSNSFESDNNANGSKVEPFTSAVFSNVTFLGPKAFDSSFQNSTDYITGGQYFPNNGSSAGKYQAAMQIRRNSHLNCFNSMAVGYPVGLIIENDKGSATQEAAENGDIELKNIIFSNMTVLGSDKNKSFAEGEFSGKFFTKSGNKVLSEDDLQLKNGSYLKVPCLSANAQVLNGASFDNQKLAGFDKVSYIGAFGENDNWLKGWTNFNPNNTDY